MKSEEDFEADLTKLEVIIKKCNGYKTNQQEMQSIIRKNTDELKLAKNIDNSASKELEDLCDTSNKSVSYLYTELQGKFQDIKKDCIKLQKDNFSLKETALTEQQCVKRKYQHEEESLDNKLTSDIQTITEEYSQKLWSYKKKEDELLAELHTSETNAQRKFETVKLDLNSQLTAVKKKLCEANNSCSTLRTELLSFKNNTNNSSLKNYKEKSQQLEEKLQFLQQNLQITRMNLCETNRKALNISTNPFVIRQLPSNYIQEQNEITVSHQIIDVSQTFDLNNVRDINNCSKIKCAQFESKTKNTRALASNVQPTIKINKCSIVPLMPCTVSGPSGNISKKQKLCFQDDTNNYINSWEELL